MLKQLYRIDKTEFGLSILATLGVVAVGAIHAILFVIVLALVRFVHLVSRPKVELLGLVEGVPGFHSFDSYPEAAPITGLLLFRFNAPVIFFNAPHFKREVLAAADNAGSELKWIAIDMLPVTMIDATGIYTVDELIATLQDRGISLVAAGRKREWQLWSEKHRFKLESEARIFDTLGDAVEAYRREATQATDTVTFCHSQARA